MVRSPLWLLSPRSTLPRPSQRMVNVLLRPKFGLLKTLPVAADLHPDSAVKPSPPLFCQLTEDTTPARLAIFRRQPTLSFTFLALTHPFSPHRHSSLPILVKQTLA
ncbi:hypothetical protein BDZ97DRAFT_1923004 [Flammula alnicola]|nr:hypothetical protein BDZ97DRAFT_1923004 [Flammula alnicola]